jgi:hypothetical protein
MEKNKKIDVVPEPTKVTERKIVKFEAPMSREVKDFSFNPIGQTSDHDYTQLKQKYGALASTDTDRRSKTQKDQRFSINPLVKAALPIEQEERRIVDQKNY